MILEMLRRCVFHEKIIDYEWVKNANQEMIIKTDRATYRGSCTVWYQTHPYFHRCSTSKELWFSDFWQMKKWVKLDNINNDKI